MRVVDPQSALLTNVEVYDFLKTRPPPKPEKKVGAYEQINLNNYKEIRQDILRYIENATPQLTEPGSPTSYMKDAVKRLRSYGLTKTEVYTLLNLGLGFARGSESNDDAEVASQDGAADANDSVASIHVPAGTDSNENGLEGHDLEAAPPSGIETLKLVVESFEERFPEETREATMTEILLIFQECVSASQRANTTTGA